MKEQLAHIIQEIEKELQKDIQNGTTIPAWYAEIIELLTQAKQALDAGEIEKTFELIGEINLDLLEQVDQFDDLIGEVVHKLQLLRKKYIKQQATIPTEVVLQLEQLHATINKHLNK